MSELADEKPMAKPTEKDKRDLSVDVCENLPSI